MTEIAAADVVIDVDKEALVEALEQGAARAVAFKQDHRIVRGHGVRLNGAIRKGQVLVDAWDAIVDDHVGVFAHHAQNLTAGEG